MTYAKQKVQGAKPAPLTDEEIKRKRVEFMMQKRESFAQGILYNLCQGVVAVNISNAECYLLVDVAVDMADRLIEKLYGVSFTKKENKEEETPAE